jgi:hypothetical protein
VNEDGECELHGVFPRKRQQQDLLRRAGKGRVGSYGSRYEGKRQRQKIVGQYRAAAAAKLRKELELKKACRKANSSVLPEESPESRFRSTPFDRSTLELVSLMAPCYNTREKPKRF